MWFEVVMIGTGIDDADEYVSSAIKQDMELGLKDEIDELGEETGMNMK
jgi:hypothetical protein